MRSTRVAVMGLCCVVAACLQSKPVTEPAAAAKAHGDEGRMAALPKVAPVADPVSTPALPPPVLKLEKKASSSGVLKSITTSGSAEGGCARCGAGSLAGLGSIGEAQGMGGLGLRGSGSGGSGIGVSSFGSGLGSAGRGMSSGQGYAGLGGKGVGGRVGTVDELGGSEDYGHPTVNAWTLTEQDHLSTFAADVDTASYTLGRRKLLDGQLPPADSVRVEEWLNYFRYRYPQPPADAPLAVFMDAAPSPFSTGKTLLRVGVQGRRLDVAERKVAHLTFLVDVSGSMSGPDRLPLAKRSLRMLVDQLRDGDTVALVTYAGNVRLVLPPTELSQKALIHAAIEDLSAGGSTAMGSGLELAYAQAAKTLDSRSISRVLILSDGDANVGPTNHEAILKLISGHVQEGVTVSTIGFGMGNYKAALMEQLADKGNGNHFYVDSALAAKRIFVEELGGTLEVIAQDVKLQVDFDPRQVNAYRLIGYENRDIADRDFRNDKVDAGEIGSGHTVTALYEVDLKAHAGEGLCTVRVRAKKPRGVSASERAFPFAAAALHQSFEEAPQDLRFATAVMGAAEIFRRSPWASEWSYAEVQRIARAATPAGNAEREEFLQLLERGQSALRRVAARELCFQP